MLLKWEEKKIVSFNFEYLQTEILKWAIICEHEVRKTVLKETAVTE